MSLQASSRTDLCDNVDDVDVTSSSALDVVEIKVIIVVVVVGARRQVETVVVVVVVVEINDCHFRQVSLTPRRCQTEVGTMK